MLIPRIISTRKKGSYQNTNLPSLAEAKVLVAQQTTQTHVVDRETWNQQGLEKQRTTELISCQKKGLGSNNESNTVHTQGNIMSSPTQQNRGSEMNTIYKTYKRIRKLSILVEKSGCEPLVNPENPNPVLIESTTSRGSSYSGNRIIVNITGYRDSPQTAALSSQSTKELRASRRIAVEGRHPPKLIQSFKDCNLPEKMLSNITEQGYIEPRDVQMQAIPAGLYGRDMIISAATGTGKTAGYLIPTLAHAYGLSQLPGDAMEGPYVLILVPTRELAIQIEDVVKRIVRGMPNMRTALLVGGQAMTNQMHRLKQNVQIAIATPGRMVDIMAKDSGIGFSNVFSLVLDEVDLMLSMGFRKQVRRILDILPEPPNGRQSIVCSATLSRQVEQLVAKLVNDELRIRVGDLDKEDIAETKQAIPKFSNVFSPSSKIKQTVLWVENDSKKKQLFSLLRDPTYFRPPVLVFVESRLGADLLAQVIQIKCPAIVAASIHGEKTQEERTGIINLFTSGKVPVLVATGLLARGLDLKVATVINFDMAPSLQEYVHRVGRANAEAATKAAANIRKGPKLGGMAWAITFINNDHRSILGELANMLHKLGLERVTPLPPQLKQLVVPEAANTKPNSVNKNPSIKELPKILNSKRKSQEPSNRQNKIKRSKKG
ncbi:DEAD (Asp-Glu-Ala-Asp) box polypeptide 59 [Entomortierella beljakovae]|nr:DEAD (Asp-Glu-Ala-Asp) box polypeptide 59 [Entomortierella beljakovae]